MQRNEAHGHFPLHKGAQSGVRTNSKGPVAGEVQDITMRWILPVYGPIDAGRVTTADTVGEEEDVRFIKIKSCSIPPPIYIPVDSRT
jgi:hypothetical protein